MIVSRAKWEKLEKERERLRALVATTHRDLIQGVNATADPIRGTSAYWGLIDRLEKEMESLGIPKEAPRA